MREADRQALTYVFAVDDSFVVRSLHYELPKQKLVSDCRFEYDHPDGQPVLRSLVTTVVGQPGPPSDWMWRSAGSGRSPRPNSRSNRFWPTSSPAKIIRNPVVQPAIVTILGWYWMAFVAGGISLAGGCGLALRSRCTQHHTRNF